MGGLGDYPHRHASWQLLREALDIDIDVPTQAQGLVATDIGSVPPL